MLLLIPDILLAEAAIASRDKPNVLVIIGDEPRIITLEARQAPLGQVLDEIASKTGTRVHYSILPKESVTATCAGETVKAVMKCLLGPDADMMFRYPSEFPKEGSSEQPTELWVLGSSFGGGQSSARDFSQCAMTGTGGKLEPRQTNTARTISSQSEPEDTSRLMEMAQGGNPAQRANAIARLIADGRMDEDILRITLEKALADEDASVRAQAVYGLARQGGASVILQAALHDSDASVRLMAVDNAGTSPQDLALLREALTDSDETVSALAALKLESFVNSGMSR